MPSFEEARSVPFADAIRVSNGQSSEGQIAEVMVSVMPVDDAQPGHEPSHGVIDEHGNNDDVRKSVDAREANNDKDLTTKESTTVEQQHHQAGFSAQAFASYEERLKAPISKLSNTVSARETVSSLSFTESSDLEKGNISNHVTDIKEPARAHARWLSTSSTDSVGTTHSLDSFNIPIPEKRHSKPIRNMRHTSFNVYRRLFSIVFIANLIAFIILLAKTPSIYNLNLSNLATAASANFTVAILIRQDYIVNFCYRICWMIPHSAPLRIRRMLAKVYENGGVHSGAAVAGTVWFLLLTVIVTIFFAKKAMQSVAILSLTYVLLTILTAIIVFAYPRFRFKSHNAFEYSHRFAGWTAIAIFWGEAGLLIDQLRKTNNTSFGHEMLRLPTFWFLIIITFHLVLPWIQLRKWHFQPDQLSPHALRLNFDHNLPPLSGLAIAETPFGEWHPFATFPKASGGGSMIISNAGDWTKRTICSPKTRYWVKGNPKTGVLSMAFVFRRVVIVTTGSGIGPCLSFLLEPSRKTDCRVLWSTPSPLKTYGQALYNSVLQSDSNAVIIDTRASGRPDMVSITYNLFVESGAEAVFVISNPRLTKKIVYGMESRGIPAFGPIWDS